MLQPTKIGSAAIRQAEIMNVPNVPQSADLDPVSVSSGAVMVVDQQPRPPKGHTLITISEEQLAVVEATVSQMELALIPAGDIVRIGFEAESALQRTLDGFLARLDKNTAGKVFELFGKLQKGVADTNLPALLVKIKDDKPGMLGGLMARVRGKSAQDLAREGFEETRKLITGKTKTLADVMVQLESQLQSEMASLFSELSTLDQLKISYRDQLRDFALAAAIAQAFLIKSQAYIESQRAIVAQSGDPMALARFQEMENKLQLLESRSLALEGVYTRLPADQMVIQQIQSAGIATLQETATTAASRFSSIKMTLLALHGAFAVRGVQQLAASQANLDQQLVAMRGQLMNEVVATSANAAGENRLAQAQQIETIIAQTQEVNAIVSQARKDNEVKFAQARESFVRARQTLATIQ